MQLSDVFLAVGEGQFGALLRHISFGKLKTFQIYERLKVRLHLSKMNSESLRKAAPRLWARIAERDEEFATELAQAILVSHLEMIKDVLNFLEIPHEEGFFSKDLNPSEYLQEGWQQRVYDHFKDKYPPVVLSFYLNHLSYDVTSSEDVFTPVNA